MRKTRLGHTNQKSPLEYSRMFEELPEETLVESMQAATLDEVRFHTKFSSLACRAAHWSRFCKQAEQRVCFSLCCRLRRHAKQQTSRSPLSLIHFKFLHFQNQKSAGNGLAASSAELIEFQTKPQSLTCFVARTRWCTPLRKYALK